MWQNHLKIAWRNLWKNKLTTALNVLGLTTGIIVALLLFMVVRFEWSFDKFHERFERIHRVIVTADFDGEKVKWSNAPNVVGPTMQEEISGIARQARVLKNEFGKTAFVRFGNRKFAENNLYWADSSLFNIFTFDWRAGDPDHLLTQPNEVVLATSVARKYFGDENPLGQSLEVDGDTKLTVVGVFADLPANSSLDADIIGSFSTVGWANRNMGWSNASFETWLLLHDDTSPARVETAMSDVLAKYVPEEERWFTLSLQPLSDVHFHSSDLDHQYTTRIGDPMQVRILLILALVVLLIACVNYINLATAHAQRRYREIGISKTLGAGRPHMMARFFSETALTVLISLSLSVGLAWLVLPAFNRLADKQLTLADVFSAPVLAAALTIGLLITLVAGLYPALYLSSFSPKLLLQSVYKFKTGGGLFRRISVTTQFAASFILIVSAVVFFNQLQFIQQKQLGYAPEQVMAVSTAAAQNRAQIDAFISEARRVTGVLSAARTQSYPGKGGESGYTIGTLSGDRKDIFIANNRTTSDFVETVGLKLLAGASLPANKNPEDTTTQIVLNETAVKLLGYTPEEAVGKRVSQIFGDQPTEIVGVVEDFHFESLHQPIRPYALNNNEDTRMAYVVIKLSTQDLRQTMRQLEAVFNQAMPHSAFDFNFLDEQLDTLYRADQRMARVVLVFSLLAILVACLGLFGLTVFMAEQCTKEIGIRKVLGASVAGLVALLSKDFIRLVLLALLIAAPLAWYLMRRWLQNFAYHVDLHWWVFALAGLLSVAIAFFTVSLQAVKSALANPVKSLRSE